MASAPSSATKPWSRTGTTFSATTCSITATPASVTRAYVGASGFSYAEWRGSFYPADAKPPEFLGHYAERLSAVELNNTFYRLPAEAQLERWAEATPPEFRFAVKAPMSISFFGRLDQLGTLAERLAVLGPRLGPLLVRAHDDHQRSRDGFLQLLLESLDPTLLVALDLRHPSWAGIETDLPANAVRVNQLEGETRFRYLRFSDHPYDDEALDSAAETVRDLGVETYCLFSKGAASDHSPAGEPTAVTAERFLHRLTPPGPGTPGSKSDEEESDG
ncbi:MAG: DUF72 domain-containing protein [Actinomycetota bacterium]|nr:DUF72 domain-containing protein [Actinomycetota bacterium]